MSEEPKSSVFADVWAHVKKEWPHLKAAPLALFCVFVLGGWAGWSIKTELWKASSDADARHIYELESRSSQIQKENDQLAKENNELRANKQAVTPPLKKRAEEIAQEMMQFAGQWDIGALTNQQKSQMDTAYGRRFFVRANQLYADLDQAGLDTKHLSEILASGFTPDTIRATAEEIRRLVEKLPD